MRVVIASTVAPHVKGGARFIVEWLERKLVEHGHEVERFYLPFDDRPEHLAEQLLALRLMDLSGHGDRLIAIRPPAYLLRHPAKVVWFIHHIRGYYDLACGPHRLFPDTPEGRAIRDLLHAEDTAGLREARAVFSNSDVVGERLRRYNGIASRTLYPPLLAPETFRCDGYGDEVACVCRMEPHKRQELLIDAMAHTRTGVRLRLCGRAHAPDYEAALLKRIRRKGVSDKVVFDNRWISEAEKVEIVAGALAVAYIPLDEDSYGYITLEGAAARKATITATDSGGTSEFVRHGVNGMVVAPSPEALAAAMDALHEDRAMARRLGEAAARTVAELGIDWDHVIGSLLA